MQLFLFPKIIFGVFVFSRNSVQENCSPEKAELAYEIVDFFFIVIVVLEELILHNHDSTQIILILIMVFTYWLVKLYEYFVFDDKKKYSFNACVAIGNLILFFLLQTMIQELDSYECVVISIALQTGLFMNDLLNCLFWTRPNHSLERFFKLCIVLFLFLPSLIYNHSTFTGVFFEEISSLLNISTELLSFIFYITIFYFVIKI